MSGCEPTEKSITAYVGEAGSQGDFFRRSGAKSAADTASGRRGRRKSRCLNMKRYGGLFDTCFSEANLYCAYMDARQTRRSRWYCIEFERRLESNLSAIEREIKDGSYRPRSLHSFTVYSPKPREIQAPKFRDLIVQHAIYRVVFEIFDRSFIDQSFACRVGRGVLACGDYVQAQMRRLDGYLLHLDVRRYFASIDRDVLEGLIRRKIKDQRLVDAMMLFVVIPGRSTGIPIGNLLSQVYALIYLNPIDHYVKRELKVEGYARYMDDMLLIGITAEQCKEYTRMIAEKLKTDLKLDLSKSASSPISRGINFVGFRTWRSKRFIRKHSLYKFRDAVRRNKRDVVVSLLGHALHTSSLSHMLKLLKEDNYELYLSLPRQYQAIVVRPA